MPIMVIDDSFSSSVSCDISIISIVFVLLFVKKFKYEGAFKANKNSNTFHAIYILYYTYMDSGAGGGLDVLLYSC